MELILLAIPACPKAAVFEERLAVALAGRPDAILRRREVVHEAEAVQAGMRGSPTLLIDGVDPFAAPGQPPGLSCRLYRDMTGRPVGAPTVQALRQALEQASRRGRATAGQPGDRVASGREPGPVEWGEARGVAERPALGLHDHHPGGLDLQPAGAGA